MNNSGYASNKGSFPGIHIYQRIVRAKLFIDTHYAEQIDVRKIAGEAYFSRFHFIRLFKSIYGKTPHQYVISVRIAKAKNLLLLSSNIAEVCFAVGFDSVTSFSSLFRRATGFSTAAYRKVLMRKKTECLKNPLLFIPGCHANQTPSLHA